MNPTKTLLLLALGAALIEAQTQNFVKATAGAPPAAIPTFSTEDLSRTGIFYAGAMEADLLNGNTTVKTYWPLGLGVEIDAPAMEQRLTQTTPPSNLKEQAYDRSDRR